MTDPTPRPERTTVADFQAIPAEAVTDRLTTLQATHPGEYLVALAAMAQLAALLEAPPRDDAAARAGVNLQEIIPGVLEGARRAARAFAADIPSEALAELAHYVDHDPAELAAQAIDFARTLPNDRIDALVALLSAREQYHDDRAWAEQHQLWQAIHDHLPGLSPLLYLLREHIDNARPGGCAAAEWAACHPWPLPPTPAPPAA